MPQARSQAPLVDLETPEAGGSRTEHDAGAAAHKSVVLLRREDDTLLIRLGGAWSLELGIPSTATVERELAASPAPKRVAFDASEPGRWDSALVTFVAKVNELCRARGIPADHSGLPAGLRRLLQLAEAAPGVRAGRAGAQEHSLLTRIGEAIMGYVLSVYDALAFVGDLTVAFANLLRGRARYLVSDLVLTIQQCGANALVIVSVNSVLVGVILAFMGAVQLQRIGAQIFVANLVAVAMVREMGAMMTAIIMSGRTGAAFAAQLGTMKVTQEIDALRTMGISPMEFLVLPRVIALVLMMPLLCAYSNFLGIMGGAAVGSVMLHLSLRTYLDMSVHAIDLTSLFGGLFKATTYGVLIALSGCLRGFQCGSSSSAVGDAATAAVVTSIVLVVAACGIFAFIFNILGI